MRKLAYAMAACGALLVAPPVAAHVTLTPPIVEEGRTFLGAFRVGHGCAGSATRSLRALLPPEVASARPQAKAGWTVTLEHAPGTDGKDRVVAITWSGGEVPDDEFDDFGVQLGLQASPGFIHIPVVQICEKGEEHWDEVSAPGVSPHTLKRPAAMIEIVSAPPMATLNGLELRKGWVRAAPKGAPSAAAYLAIHNGSKQADRLIGVSTTAAAKAELHTMTIDAGVMRMRRLTHGISIAAGGDAALAPGGNHIMLFDPRVEIESGGKIELTLIFQHAGRVSVTLPVRAGGDEGGEHHHGGA